MCTRETPRAERAMCGCYTRRAVVIAVAAVVVVAAAVLVPSFELVAFVAAGVAAVGIVLLARSRGGGLELVSRTHRWEAEPEPAEEPGASPWWEQSSFAHLADRSLGTWPPRSQEGGHGPHRHQPPSTAHLN